MRKEFQILGAISPAGLWNMNFTCPETHFEENCTEVRKHSFLSFSRSWRYFLDGPSKVHSKLPEEVFGWRFVFWISFWKIYHFSDISQNFSHFSSKTSKQGCPNWIPRFRKMFVRENILLTEFSILRFSFKSFRFFSGFLPKFFSGMFLKTASFVYCRIFWWK